MIIDSRQQATKRSTEEAGEILISKVWQSTATDHFNVCSNDFRDPLLFNSTTTEIDRLHLCFTQIPSKRKKLFAFDYQLVCEQIPSVSAP